MGGNQSDPVPRGGTLTCSRGTSIFCRFTAKLVLLPATLAVVLTL